MSELDIRQYDELVLASVATEDEIDLVRCVLSGDWSEILKAILFARTGYRSFEQWYEEDEYAEEVHNNYRG